MPSSLQNAAENNQHRFPKRPREEDAVEYEPLQNMVKRLRVDDSSSPNAEEQIAMRYHQQQQFSQQHQHQQPQSYLPQQYQVNAPQTHGHHHHHQQQQARSSKYITRIQYHSNLGGETVRSDITVPNGSFTAQTAGEDTCSSGGRKETINNNEMISPMNRLLGSLHHQRRIQKIKNIP
mmetsp:Transcript_31288/g.47749  ORF Transcript_31288/g.47749 Transcript_31288/m.47749 type:complete len:178 (+) Transcript_31288:143-676(+)|eukprot:CAMPEP_0194232464 /NCGR_PEP_ID=MMETSP0158-20130606/820_1 /TAXON_ID=33649 /ORGANISM="Thalassionema nitzschioides, Strain L26-B" /LENGTH=177 /DNA_ID=CAMNT_0038965227 /DNA_START=131 /DNA_END=664 /DNA_ORIENTATION=-